MAGHSRASDVVFGRLCPAITRERREPELRCPRSSAESLRKHLAVTSRSGRCSGPAGTTRPSSSCAPSSSPTPCDLVAKELLFDAFFQKREWAAALALAEELVGRRPDIARFQKARIATLSNMKRYDETIAQASQYIDRSRRRPHHPRHPQGGEFLQRPHQRGDPPWPARARPARRRGLPDAAALHPDRAGGSAFRAKGHFIFAVGDRTLLQLRRHDQPGAEPHRLSRLDLPVLRRRRQRRRPASPSCATTAPSCATSRTNIPASACSSAFW